MGIWTANAVVGAAILLTGVSLLLATIGFVSLARLKHAKLAWVGLAFVGFAAEGAALTWWAYEKRADLAAGGATDIALLTGLNLAIVVALYLAVLKR